MRLHRLVFALKELALTGLAILKSPGEIKRREVNWTHKKTLAQKRSRTGRWCWATERELDFFCFSCFPAAELQTLSL